jgi:hypothetical protein
MHCRRAAPRVGRGPGPRAHCGHRRGAAGFGFGFADQAQRDPAQGGLDLAGLRGADLVCRQPIPQLAHQPRPPRRDELVRLGLAAPGQLQHPVR